MEDQKTPDVCLEVLPRSIYDTHRRVLQLIEKLCVLEDFLIGSQVEECANEEEEELHTGIVDKCFRNLAKLNGKVEESYEQLENIITQLGVSEKPGVER